MAPPIISIFSSGDYEAQVRRGAEQLKSGGLVVLPTETVYGIAGLLTSKPARQRLEQLRVGGSSGRQPFTIHLAHPEDAERYLGSVNEYARRLIRKLWPGPVSMIFDVPAERRKQVAKQLGVPEGDLYDATGNITLRCADNVVATDVLGEVEGPVALTAAGSSQSAAHWSAEQLAEELAGKVDLIFDAGPPRYSKASTMIKVGADGYQIVRQGVYDERIIDRLLRTTILFVCSGNTCRSPMSEVIARQVLSQKLGVGEAELEKKGINVISAGSFALPGARATPQAVEALRGLGLDLSPHRSKPLTVELIHQADRIFTMSRSHALAVLSLVPSAAQKVATLDPDKDVDDPIGSDVGVYKDLAGQLRTLIEKRMTEIMLP